MEVALPYRSGVIEGRVLWARWTGPGTREEILGLADEVLALHRRAGKTVYHVGVPADGASVTPEERAAWDEFAKRVQGKVEGWVIVPGTGVKANVLRAVIQASLIFNSATRSTFVVRDVGEALLALAARSGIDYPVLESAARSVGLLPGARRTLG